MLDNLRPAAVLLVLLTVLTGIVYPFAVWGVSQLIMPWQANGSPVIHDGKVSGSVLIGQNFTTDRYFHGRPSATSTTDPNDSTKTVDLPYNAVNSSGSNLGPISKKLLTRIDADVATLKKAGATRIPADSVTTSASGLDPHISPAFAELQIERIATSRNVSSDRVRAILKRQTASPLFGIFGEPRVNVLELNLALDAGLSDSAG